MPEKAGREVKTESSKKMKKDDANTSAEKKLDARLNKERAELFRHINLKIFEDLAKKKGVTLEQLLSARIKSYLEKEEKK